MMTVVLKKTYSMLILICISMVFAACTGAQLNRSADSSSSSAPEMPDEDSPRYYDFVDVLLPGELKVDDKSTFVVQVSGFATGVLVLDGRVKRNSLIEFFQINMAKDNWEAISFFKSPRTNSFLLYKKSNRWCVISIKDREFTTHVEIGVAPAAGEKPSGLYR